MTRTCAGALWVCVVMAVGLMACVDLPSAAAPIEVSSVCGDEVVAEDEICDEGPEDTAACNGAMAGTNSCMAAGCGDGYVNTAAQEECDEGDTATCNGYLAEALGCRTARCGDGYLNAAAGELCDDGNAVSGDGCSARCLPVMGTPDLVVEPPSLDFGLIRTADPVVLPLTMSNMGDGPLELLGVSLTGSAYFSVHAGDLDIFAGFEWRDDPDQDGTPGLGAGASVVLQVTYTPTRMGADLGELVFESDDPNTPSLTIPLKGNDGPCLRLASPQSAGGAIELEAMEDGDATAEIILSSCGTQPLVISAAGLSMSSDPRFSVTNADDLVFPVTLAPKPAEGAEERIVVELAYEGADAAPGQGQFVVDSNDARFPDGLPVRLVGPAAGN